MAPLIRRSMFAVPVLLALGALYGCAGTATHSHQPAASNMPAPPLAEVRPYQVASPNGARTDNYYWLRDDSRKDPKMLAYLKAENDYYTAMSAPTKALEDTLYGEIVGRIKQDDASVPVRHRHFFYYTRYQQGSEYPLYARKKDSLTGTEQIMLDGTALAQGHDFFQVGGWQVSPNERLLAYAEDLSGRRQFTIRFKDLDSGKTLADEILNTPASMAWADDNKSLFYVENDPVTLLTVRVKKHLLGTPAASDTLVYEEKDPSYYMGVARSGDEKYVVIDEHSTLSAEVRFLPAAQPNGAFRVLLPRQPDHIYDADHIGQRWIVRSNAQAKNFRLMQIDDGQVGSMKHWHELVPTSDAVLIENFSLFRNYLVIGEHSEGLQRILIKPWKGGKPSFVKSDEPAYSATLGANREQNSEMLRYDYTSLTTPNTAYDLNMRTGERSELKRDTVLGDFDPTHYVTERLWVPARDGANVPVSVVYRRGLKLDGTAPLYQRGYGSYGISSDPRFSSAQLSLLDRGFVVAIAHIRGGEEMGRQWYEDGKLLKKKNTFTDFIDVSEYLVAHGYAARDKVFAVGGSAGGLLMGAIANMAPQDYRGIVAHVPFVDVVTTMLDESIPLTTNEFDEWGNPKQAKYYDYMRSYSPYDNVTAQAYPAMLVTTGLWDSQVQYYEPSKWVAKLRATRTDHNPLLFKVNMEAGHGGKSGRFERYREVAEEYAFVLGQLHVTQ